MITRTPQPTLPKLCIVMTTVVGYLCNLAWRQRQQPNTPAGFSGSGETAAPATVTINYRRRMSNGEEYPVCPKLIDTGGSLNSREGSRHVVCHISSYWTQSFYSTTFPDGP